MVQFKNLSSALVKHLMTICNGLVRLRSVCRDWLVQGVSQDYHPAYAPHWRGLSPLRLRWEVP